MHYIITEDVVMILGGIAFLIICYKFRRTTLKQTF
jgi:hypothetical protein